MEAEPFEYEGDRFKVTVSVGVATLDGEGSSRTADPAEFIRMADDNLYKAKRGGRNCVIG